MKKILLFSIILLAFSSQAQDNLIGDYRLDGNANDLSNSGNSATATDVTYHTDRRGTATSAAVFSQASSRLEVPTNMMINYNDISVSLWVKTTDAQGIILGHQDVKYPNSSGAHAPSLYVNSGLLRGGFWSGAVRSINSGVMINDDQWHHIALVSINTGQSLYVDGTLVGTQQAASILNDLDENSFGTGYATTSWGFPSNTWHALEGQLDDIKVYQRELTEVEIAALAGQFSGTFDIADSTYTVATTRPFFIDFNTAVSSATAIKANFSVTGATTGAQDFFFEMNDSFTEAYINPTPSWDNDDFVLKFQNLETTDGDPFTDDSIFFSTTNLAPTVNGSIADISLGVNFGKTKFLADLDTLFEDPEDGDLTITSSMTNPLVTVDQDDDNRLFIREITNQTGSTIVTIQAEDGSNTVSTTFEVSITGEIGSLEDGLRIKYALDGTAFGEDDVNTGTEFAVTATTDRAGNETGAVTFLSDESRITLPEKIIFEETNVSVSVWFKTSETNGIILGNQTNDYPNGSGFYAPTIYINSTGQLKAGFFPRMAQMGSAVAVNDNEWHHVALITTDETQTLYLDGIEIGEAGGVDLTDTRGIPFTVGSGFSATNWGFSNSRWQNFQGALDDFRIYDRSITQEEVGTLSEVLTAEFTPSEGTKAVSQEVQPTVYFAVPMEAASTSSLNNWSLVGSQSGDIPFSLSLEKENMEITIIPSETLPLDDFILSFENIVSQSYGTAPNQSVSFSTINETPEAILVPDDITLTANFRSTKRFLDLDDVFTDPEAQSLTYQVQVSPEGILSADLNEENQLKFTSIADQTGTAQVTIIASDGTTNSSINFQVLVDEPSTEAQDGLIFQYKLDDGALDAININDGVAVDLAPATNRDDKSAQASSFDLATSRVEIPSELMSEYNDITVSMWFKTGTSLRVLLGQQQNTYPNSSSQNVPVLYINSNGQLAGSFWTGTVSSINSTVNAVDGEWHHVALTSDVNGQTLYIDGQAEGNTSSVALLLPSADHFTIGAGYSGTAWGFGLNGWSDFDGSIDDIKVFARALDATQVNALFNAEEVTPPTLVKAIPDQNAEEDAAMFAVADLDTVFHNNGNLVYSATSNTNVITSLSGSILSISLAEDFNGEAQVTVTADSSGFRTRDRFVLNVSPVNDAPEFDLDNNEIVVSQNFNTTETIAVMDQSPSNESSQTITYSISPTSIALANISINSETGLVSITSILDQIGSQEFTITADDAQGEHNIATNSFSLTVLENTAPTAVINIESISIDEDAQNISLDISASEAFTDPDGDELSVTVSDDFDGDVAISFVENVLRATPALNYNGVGNITLNATDGSLSTEYTFELIVNAINDAPTVISSTTIAGVEDDFISITIDASLVFEDVDGDALTYRLASSTVDDFLQVAISREIITFLPITNGFGSGNIDVIASDGLEETTYTLPVTISATNDIPDVIGNPTLQFVEDAGVQTLDLNTVFSDIDGDELNFSASSQETAIVNFSFANSGASSILEVTPIADANGNQVITLLASDGVSENTYDLNVTVDPVNDSPSFTIDKTELVLLSNFETTEIVSIIVDPVPENEMDQSVMYTISPNDGSLVNFEIVGNAININAVAEVFGTQTFEIIADDGSEENNTFSTSLAIEIVKPLATQAEIQLSIYPNPSNNYLKIIGLTSADVQYEITDLEGKRMVEDSYQRTIDISFLEVGVYFLQIKETTGQTKHIRFVKQN